VEALVEEAAREGYACVVATPLHVAEVSGLARRLGVRLCAVIGFPLGSQPLEAKLAEVKLSVDAGAEELDLVPALWRGPESVAEEVRAVVEAAGGARVKVILEAPLWGDGDLERLVDAAARGGAWMVKTSTGVYTKGGDPYTVARLARAARPRGLGVKASGGIRTAVDALLAVGAGASRIGTSSAKKILETLEL
jgi:deoxyribose-phosphate aldolase